MANLRIILNLRNFTSKAQSQKLCSTQHIFIHLVPTLYIFLESFKNVDICHNFHIWTIDMTYIKKNTSQMADNSDLFCHMYKAHHSQTYAANNAIFY